MLFFRIRESALEPQRNSRERRGSQRNFTVENCAMLIKKPADIHPSEITPPELYARRREFLKTAAVLGAAALLPPILGGTAAQATDDELKPTP